MRPAIAELDSALKLRRLSVHRLHELYESTVSKLRKCADTKLRSGHAQVAAEKLEADLLDFEHSILSQAARIKIQSKEDLLGLMDIWQKASGVNAGQEIDSDQALSNRIVMNIFRHMADAKFVKD